MKKIYVGCSLYDASEEFRNGVAEFKKRLEGHFEVLKFIGVNNWEAEEVAAYDLAKVKECDVFVGICDLPSIGLGIEIGTANAQQKKMFLCAKTSNISKMVRGNSVANPKSQFIEYSSLDSLLESIIEECK